MDEEDNILGKAKKAIKSVFSNKYLIILLIILILIPIFAMIAAYVKNKDDFTKASKKSSSYNVGVDANGNLTVSTEDGEKTLDEMVTEMAKLLKDYLSGTEEERKEKVLYLIGAEHVTQYPYIDDFESSEEEDTKKFNGRIKFYRYGDDVSASNAYDGDTLKEEYRITYKNQEEFETLLENYRNNRNDSEVLKHFTIDSSGSVIIAITTLEERSITTDDSQITVDTIKQVSGQEGYTGNASNGFGTSIFTVNTKPIDYLSSTAQYTMPVNLLYALLVQTGDYNFVKQIADLAYETEIAVGIYDNETVSTNTEDFTYKKLIGMDIETKLNLEGMATTSPAITKSSLYNLPYSATQIIFKCLAKTSMDGTIDGIPIEKGALAHKKYYYSEAREKSDDFAVTNYMYVTGMNGNLVTSLGASGSGSNFKAKFTKVVTSRSTPTIGVILADTWIGRWKTTYTKQENEPNTSENSGTNEDKAILEYNSSDGTDIVSILQAVFDSNMSNDINNKLTEHAEGLRTNAIETIVEVTDFTIPLEEITENDISSSDRRNILFEHLRVDNNCWESAYKWWANNTGNEIPSEIPEIEEVGNISQILTRVLNAIETGPLSSSVIAQHYRQDLQQEINYRNNEEKARNQQEQENRENTFINELDSQITCSQTLKLTENNVDISFTSVYTVNSSTYQKDEEVQRDKMGEKFSEIFNDSENYESRDAILTRTGWFWEYIRENEDTAKIENIIRYLLNIATDSEEFGTFTDEEIDELLSSFEPQELKNSGTSSYGGGYIGALAEWLKSYENEALRQYVNGETSNYSSVSNWVVVGDDGKLYGKMYYTDFDGCYNYTYGIMVRNKSGNLNNERVFADYGYNLADLVSEKLNGGDALVPIEDLDKIFNQLVGAKVDNVRESIESKGVTMEEWQYCALASVSYQYGNCGQYILGDQNIAKVYEKYYAENPDAFKQNAVCQTGSGGLVHFFVTGTYPEREHNVWRMFNEGKFILSTGTELSISETSSVVDFARQFNGKRAAEFGLFSYKSSDGKAFWADHWCAMFVSYCFDQCNIINSIGGTYVGCTAKLNEMESDPNTRNQVIISNTYIPKAGDVIFFSGTSERSSHTGIVTSCDGAKVYTIEGNTTDGVTPYTDFNHSIVHESSYNIGSSYIYGYIIPKQ